MRKVLLVPLVLVAGCADSTADIGTLGPSDASPVDASFPTDATSFGGDGPEASACFRCSDDLHEVRDCSGNVVARCNDDQGCDPVKGACVDACEAARVNGSSVGCDYYAVQPDGSRYSKLCYAAFVTNTWPAPVTLGAQLGKQSLNLSAIAYTPVGSGASLTYEKLPGAVLAPGQMAVIFLSGIPYYCPEKVTVVARPNVVGTDISDAFHITSDHPVSAFDMYSYGFGGDAVGSATLLLPSSAWGTNYLSVSPYEPSTVEPDYLATLQIVAQEDGTSVTVVPSSDIVAGFSLPASPKNTPLTYTLNEGQVLQLATKDTIDGNIIQANKPVGVWSTSALVDIEATLMSGDTAHQQLPSVQTTGSEYVAVRYRNRVAAEPEEAPPWRIMGLTDDTTLTYDPAPPPGAPTTLKAGQVVKFSAAGPFVVKSQDDAHPIYVSAHMTTCNTVCGPENPYCNGSDACPGDPEFINVVPASQYLSSYDFFTDPSYPDTNLVVVRTKTGDGTFKDVTLDCAGTLSGWAPVGTEGRHEYTRVDLSRDGQPQNGCDNGRHTMKSDAPFGLTVWSWSFGGSYAYPAGVRSRPLNTVVIPPIPR